MERLVRLITDRLWIGLVALIPMVAAGATSFTLTAIPLLAPAQPGQAALTPIAINSSGQVTGTALAQGGGYHAFLYSGETVQDLGTLAATGNANVVATATGVSLNDSGTVVGSLLDAITDEFSQGFLYANGTMTVLTNPAGEARCAPSGINNDGLIVGSCYSTGSVYFGLIYMNGAWQKQTGANAFDAVNDAGQIVGINANSQAVLYEGSTYTVIPELPGQQQLVYSVATSINNAGQVVGVSKTGGSGNYLPWSYISGATQALPPIPDDCGGISTCYGGGPKLQINNAGQVIGTAYTFPSQQLEYTPFLIENGALTELNALIDPNDPNAAFVTILEANGINDDGWIVATGIDSRTQVKVGYILKPVTPLPPALNIQAPQNAAAGTAFHVTWTNQSVSGCTASGGTAGDGWAGPMSAHGGQQVVSESMAGTFTYTLTCNSTAAPMTASASVKVATTPGGTMTGGMSGSSSGGGGMDLLTLIGLISALAAKVAGRALRFDAFRP